MPELMTVRSPLAMAETWRSPSPAIHRFEPPGALSSTRHDRVEPPALRDQVNHDWSGGPHPLARVRFIHRIGQPALSLEYMRQPESKRLKQSEVCLDDR